LPLVNGRNNLGVGFHFFMQQSYKKYQNEAYLKLYFNNAVESADYQVV
jgi:hypothetical protein